MNDWDYFIMGFMLMLCLFFVWVLIDMKRHPHDYH